MDVFEELSRKLTMIEARIASYERLHTEELVELKSMLQSLKVQQVALQSQAARDAARQLEGEPAVEARRSVESPEGNRDESVDSG